MALGGCAEAAEAHPLWPASQCSSRPPREDQIAFLLMLSYPVGARSGCCSWVVWETALGRDAQSLEGVSNCVLWWHLMQMGWFFIHLRQRLAKSLLQWKSCCSEHLSKSLGGLLCREVRLQSRFSYHVLRLCMICGACISFSSVLSAVRLRSLLSPCYDAD